MGPSTEQLGRELARQIHVLAALKESKKESLKGFQMREQAIVKEINRLALDVRTGQGGLYPQAADKEP
jgi:hypothetical protein